MSTNQLARAQNANSEPERLALVISALSELNRDNAPAKVSLLIDRLRRIHMGGEMSPVSGAAEHWVSPRAE